MKIAHIVNISGGKDSTACALLALDMVRDMPRRQKAKIVFVFADTTHEAEETYEYLSYLEKRLNIGITRVKADFTDKFDKKRETVRTKWAKDGVDPAIIKRTLENLHPTGHAFTDMCLLHGMFPSKFHRFCTKELKIFPINKQVIEPLIAEGYKVIQWIGMRKDESRSRAGTRLARRHSAALRDYHPIRDWTTEQVFEFIKSKKVERNTLYDMGAKRVGCAPCIYARKEEVALIGTKLPKNIDRVREMEKLVSMAVKNNKAAAFFSNKGKYYQTRYKEKGLPMLIDEAVGWATGGWREDEIFYEHTGMSEEELTELMFHDDCESGGYCG